MATDNVTIIRVKTGEAVQSVNDLKENVKILKENLGSLQIGSDKYQDTLIKLQESQNALKDAMYATSSSMAEVSASAKGINVVFDENNKLINQENQSYNALVHTMAELKTRWRATTDEAERAELGERIDQINTRLKDLDKSIGNNQRNVGNYQSAFDGLSGAFKATAGSAGSIIDPLASVNMGLKTMSATPVIGVLGLLANVLSRVMSSLDSSEDATNRMNKAMAGFGVITDGVTTLLQNLGNGIAWVVEKFSALTSAIMGTTEQMQKREELAQRTADLAKQERENLMKDAEDELEIAKLREKASDKLHYTAEERLKFQQQAGEIENAMAKDELENLKAQYEIIKEKNALADSSAEDMRKEAEAYANMVKAETAYYQKVTSNNKQLSALRREEISDAKNATKARMDAFKAQVSAEKELIEQQIELVEKGSAEELALQRQKAEKDYELAVMDAKSKIKNQDTLNKTLSLLQQKHNKDMELLDRAHQQKIEEQQNLHLLNLANQYAEGTKEYLSAMRDLRKQELEQIQREEGETEAEYNARRLEAQKKYNASVRALNDKNVQDSTAELRLAIEKEYGNTEAKYAGLMQLAQSYYDNLLRLEGETDTEYEIRRATALNSLKEAQENYFNYLDEQERLSYENRMNSYEEGSVAYLASAVDLKRYELDTLHQLEGESNEEFRKRELEAEKAYSDAKLALWQGYVENFASVADATSSIFGSLADIYEADEENNRESAKKIKALRIAEATINTINGAITAFMANASRPIYALAQATAVTTAGMANIAKIRNTSIGGGSSASTSFSSASVSAPQVDTSSVSQVRNITSASEEERLNQMASDQRVYILASDIQASNNQIKTQVAESSF